MLTKMMSTQHLAAPEDSAHTSDWLAWLQELSEMPASVEVRKALRKAKAVLSARRHKQEKPARKHTGFERHALEG